MPELNWNTKAHFTFRKLACTHSSVVSGLYDYLLSDPVAGRGHLEELNKDGNYVLPLIDACLAQYDITGIAEHWPDSLAIKFVMFPDDDEITKDMIVTCSSVYLPWNVKLSAEQVGDEKSRKLKWLVERMELQKDRYFPFLKDSGWGEPLPNLSDEPNFKHISGLGRIIEHINPIIEKKRRGKEPPKRAEYYNDEKLNDFLVNSDTEIGAFESKLEMARHINSVHISINKDIFDFAEIRSEDNLLYIDLPGQYLGKKALTSSKSSKADKFNKQQSRLFECTGPCLGFLQNADIRI